jgi:cysteine desulfurase
MTEWESHGITADPGRVHTEGRTARAVLEDAREQVAGFFGVRPRQVVLTSGGTESINTAVWGAVQANPGPVAGSSVEHSAVREASTRSAPVVTIAADRLGRIEPEAVDEAVDRCRATHGRAPTLVHCQWANHEVGTIQPVALVAERAARAGALVHVDAAAAAGHVPIDLEELAVDLVSVSAHKMGGPAGVGALILRRGLRLDPFLVGGDQERARRAGLENLLGAVGFGAVAAHLTRPEMLAAEEETARQRCAALSKAATAVEGVTLLGDPDRRLPHLVCLTVEGVEAEPVLLGLDRAGIAAHSGSACSSETLAPSPVLEAMGVDADHSLRLSVGWSTTEEDVAAFGSAFAGVVDGLRGLRGLRA